MSLGFTEIIIIGIVAVVLLFGGKKITELSKAAGRATGEYKKARRDIERELANEDDSLPSTTETKPTDQTSSTQADKSEQNTK